jgi:hypothetical protein
MSFGKRYAASQLGVLDYKGTWNAATNSPSLASSVGDKGDYYIVSIAGTTDLNGITDWKPGDWVMFSGSEWQKLDNSDSVTSVNGQTGDVVIEQIGELDGGEAHTLYGGNGVFSGGGA